MPWGKLQAFKRQFEHEFGANAGDGPEAFERVVANEAVDFFDFGVGQSGVGFGEGHEGFSGADAEGEVRVLAGSSAMAALGVEEDGVTVKRFRFPLPPGSDDASGFIDSGSVFQHQSFDSLFATVLAKCPAVSPGGGWQAGGQLQLRVQLWELQKSFELLAALQPRLLTKV